MKPIYAFNDYLFEIWPLDGYARKHLISACEEADYRFDLVPTTMGTESYRFDNQTYSILKYKLIE